ncbi:DUF3597 domain-containing protein [Altererythrobacter sp. CAU 1778]
MGIFSSIKDAIFGKKAAAQEAPAPAPTTAPSPTNAPGSVSSGWGSGARAQVDVAEKLDSMPGADNLNWRNSIVDLLKLVGIDSSYENRKELAQELGNHDYSGSAEDNIMLHRQTMKALADNGGVVPAEFRD